jgi:hypothetical protein
MSGVKFDTPYTYVARGMIIRSIRQPGIASRTRVILDFVPEAEDDFDCSLTFPIGLLAVQQALAMPEESVGALLLPGRLAGYVAHIQEQRLAGFVRPRALHEPNDLGVSAASAS